MTQPHSDIRVVCAGRLYCDLVFTDVPRLPTLGTETFAEGLGFFAGGGAYITAATLSALGLSAELLSVMPAAPFEDILLPELARNRVDTRRCVSAPVGSDAQITVAIATDGDRAFLSRRSGAASPLPDLGTLSGVRHLHIGELRTLQEQPELLRLARDAGMTISLDCGWDDELMADVSGLAELIASVDIFFPNETEALWLDKLGIPAGVAPLTVIKCGADGAKAYGSEEWTEASSEPVEVVDATGAGDAFNGGFLSEWLTGAPIKQCLEKGNICGAVTVQARGGAGGLSRLYDGTPDARREVVG